MGVDLWWVNWIGGFMKKFFILVRLLSKHKIKFRPWYFLENSGTACYKIERVDGKDTNTIGINFFKCNNIWFSLFHEVGHIYHHGTIDFFSRYNGTYFTLRKELFASRYAIRVLKLLGEDNQKHRHWACWAYGTYLAHFNNKGEIRNIADESYKSFKTFGCNFKD